MEDRRAYKVRRRGEKEERKKKRDYSTRLPWAKEIMITKGSG